MGLFTRLALRLAGLQIHCGLLPGAALIAPCPGYRVPAVCEPVARTDAQHHLRDVIGPRRRSYSITHAESTAR